MSALSDLINSTLTSRGWEGRSLRALAAQSDGRLSKDAVRLYRSGEHGQPDEATLMAWSELLMIDVSELRAAAGVPIGDAGPYIPPPESARLSRRQRDALNELIRSFLEEAGGGSRGDTAPIDPDSPIDGRAAIAKATVKAQAKLMDEQSGRPSTKRATGSPRPDTA